MKRKHVIRIAMNKFWLFCVFSCENFVIQCRTCYFYCVFFVCSFMTKMTTIPLTFYAFFPVAVFVFTVFTVFTRNVQFYPRNSSQFKVKEKKIGWFNILLVIGII